jgi:hypothetical protein
MLTVHEGQRVLGNITLSGGTITGSTRGTRALAASAMKRHGGDAAAAYAYLAGMNNGYMAVTDDQAGSHGNLAAGALRASTDGEGLEFS